MASVDTTAAQSTNGRGSGAEIPVENPATGEVIARVEDTAPGRSTELERLGRAAQPGWQALASTAARECCATCATGSSTTATASSTSSSRRPARRARTRNLAELFYVGDALGFWAKHGEQYLADEKVEPHARRRRQEDRPRYAPLGVVGVIGPWNYPLVNAFGDCIPALLAGNAWCSSRREVTPLTSLLVAEALRRVRHARERLPGRHRRGATGAALVDEADMICSPARPRPARGSLGAPPRR